MTSEIRTRFKCAACDGAKCNHTQCCLALTLLKDHDAQLKARLLEKIEKEKVRPFTGRTTDMIALGAGLDQAKQIINDIL